MTEISKKPVEVNGHVLLYLPNPQEYGDWRCNICGTRFHNTMPVQECPGWRGECSERTWDDVFC